MRRTVVSIVSAGAMLVAVMGLAASPASASHEDGKATLFEFANEGWGYTDVEPGTGVNLAQRYTCWWWGCPNFDNKVSSVTTRGSAAMLFADQEYGGKIVCVQPHSTRNMSAAQFDDQASSVFVRSGSDRDCPSEYSGRKVTILG